MRELLFVRTSRAVTLTAAGRVLARDARTALDAVSAAAARTQRAGAPDPHLLLAIKPGGDAGLLPAVLAAYESEPDVLPVDVVFEADRTNALRQGHADAALLYTPADDLTGLDTETLLTEAPVAVLPVSHPLAHRPSLRTTDLEREKLHTHDPTDAGAVGSLNELMHLIALDRKIAVLPRSLTTPLREDLITIPVTDVPPSVLVLAWAAHSTSPSLAALARAAAKTAAKIAAAPTTENPR